MGFALWIDEDVAWAQGLHEYRPLGVAVVSVTDQFRNRDFDPRRAAPPRAGSSYAGLYPSLEQVNSALSRASQSHDRRKKAAAGGRPTPAWI